MASGEEVLAATVREYFLTNGGKVRRNDLFDHFRGQLDKFDELGTTKNRFGDIVDSLASLQSVEGEKYFVLKKVRNGKSPVLFRRAGRPGNQRKDKGVSLPASMRNFRFSAAEDAFGAGDFTKPRSSSGARPRAGFRSESHDSGMKRNNSDTSIGEKNGQGNDSGVDTATSSLPSESPKGSRQSSFSRNSDADQISQNSVASADTGVNEDEHYYDHDVPSHVLTSLEKSWMISTMIGNKSEMICQLEEDPSIVKFKDFMMGTALHWAAKQGSEELVRLLVARGADVNIKSGYTPLHLATMHGKVSVINLLIDDYHANVHIRDHSGKKAKDVATKNLSEEIKQKLAEPEAALDSNSASGFSRYLDPKDSPKLKPKLKAGASFRFLKKQKKLRRSERPVIEHWDSSRQERLESTLESNEKELYKMQRSNSGSLFPTSFYSAKKTSQSEEAEEQASSVDGGGELENSRQRSLSRSCPENEFRNLARISEGSGDERRSPPVSLSSPSAVEGGDSSSVFESDPIKRRSYSDNNLSKHAFQNELAGRLDKASDARPPSGFSEDSSTSKQSANLENRNGDFLRLKIDSSPEKRPLDPFKGKELQTFMTVPNKNREVTTPQDSKSPLRVSSQQNGQLPSQHAAQQNGHLLSGVDTQRKGKPSLDKGVSAQLIDTSVDSLGKVDRMNGSQSSLEQSSDPQHLHNKSEVLSKLNNNYKQVSEILTNNEQTNTQDEPTSPVRPPRKKDKRLKKSQNIEDNESNTFDFETGPVSMYAKESVDGIMPAYRTDKSLGSTSSYERTANVENEMYLKQKSPSSNFQNDYRMQNAKPSTDVDYKNLKQDYSGVSGSRENTRRKSDGFAILRANSDDHMLSEALHTRRKSEGTAWSVRERTGYDEFKKPEGFSRQKEVSLDHPRRRSLEEAMKLSSESTRRQSEGFTDQKKTASLPGQRRSEGFTDQRRLDGFSNQKELSLDHPRRSSLEKAMKSSSESRQDFVNEQRPGSFTDQRRLDGYSSQKELSLDHPRRRTMDSLPSRTNQTRHVLPEVLLDTTRRRASAGYTERPQDNLAPSGNDLGNQRVLPPYRPPLRPNYKPPPPPVAKQPPPYQTPQDITPAYSVNNPGYSTTRPSELPHYSSESLSKNTRPGYSSPNDVSPTAPPRKHRKSTSSEDAVYPSPPTEISPTAPPRKHRGSVPSTEYTYPPPDNISPTTSPRRYPNNYRSEDYSPTDVSPTPPSRKHRGSVRSSTEGSPTTTSRPSYPPPTSPSNVPPAPLPTYQQGKDYTFGPEVSPDHPKRRSQNYEPNDIAVIPARSYDQTEYNTQSSNYNRSERQEYFPSQGQSSYYGRSEPNEYNQTGYGNYQPQSSTSRRSDFNEYNRAETSYPQTSSVMYSSNSSYNYPSEFTSNFEPSAARDQVDGHETRSIYRRSAVDTTTRDQSPPEEVVVATSVPSEPDRYTIHPEEFRSNISEYIPIRNTSGNEYDLERRNGSFGQANYEGYTETDPVIIPKYQGHTETNITRPEFPAQNNTVEPEFIVAQQMSAHEVVSEGRPVGSREDVNTLPGTLGMEMKNKWVSNSSDGSNESTENKKYRMTSMI